MRLALGTVQFGLDYGVSNARGRPSPRDVDAILGAARAAGIDLLDTAAAYGDAEQVLARAGARDLGFNIVSKTARLSNGLDAVLARAHSSIATLGRPLDTLLVHSAADLSLQAGPALWKALERMRGAGETRRIGISVYATDAIVALADHFRPDVIQLATSVVDQRLVRNGVLARLAARGIEIHVRSAFHQGLIFVDPDRLPPKLQSRRDQVIAMQAKLAASGLKPLEAALAYLAGLPEIGALVVGVTSADELGDIVAALKAGHKLTNPRDLAMDDPLLLDPSLW